MLNQFIKRLTVVVIILFAGTLARAEELTIQLPAEVNVKSASAMAPAVKSKSTGTIAGTTLRFADLLPGVAYDVSATLADGTRLQGVDLSWYNPEPVDPAGNPMTADDQTAVRALIIPDKDFFNKIETLALAGDHSRITALVRMTRDREFYSDKGGEIITRFDLWYFRFEAGGWMKIQQGQKMLRRDRFTSRQAETDALANLRWLPTLGGIKLTKGENRTITLETIQPQDPAKTPPAPPSPEETLGGAVRESPTTLPATP